MLSSHTHARTVLTLPKENFNSKLKNSIKTLKSHYEFNMPQQISLLKYVCLLTREQNEQLGNIQIPRFYRKLKTFCLQNVKQPTDCM